MPSRVKKLNRKKDSPVLHCAKIFQSDKSGASDKLEELGFNVEYVGALISDSIKAGYIPMIF
jgi:hypothetical protein